MTVRQQAAFSQLSRQATIPYPAETWRAAWDALAGVVELHLAAEDEICGPAVCRAGPHGPPALVRGRR